MRKAYSGSPTIKRAMRESFPNRRGPARRRHRPGVLALEERLLLTSLQDALNAYNNGVQLVANGSTGVASALGSAFAATPPILGDNLSDLLGLNDLLEEPFQSDLAGSTWAQVAAELPEGFSVVMPFSGSPDMQTGDLFTLSYTATVPVPISGSLNGSTGFSYIDNALQGAGIVSGAISGSAQAVVLQLTMGVDTEGGGSPTFFLDASPSASNVTVQGLTASASLSGSDLQIGDLADVSITQATASTSLGAGLLFRPSAAETDGKLRSADLASPAAYVGTINGLVDLSGSFSTQLSLLPSLNWTATFSGTITNNTWSNPEPMLAGPSWESFVSGVASQVLTDTPDFPILGGLGDFLDQPLPLIDESLDQIFGIDAKLPDIPTLGSMDLGSLDPADLLNTLYGLGFQVDGQSSPPTDDQLGSMIQGLIAGNYENLISWSASNSVTLLDWNEDIPVYSLGVPGLLSLDIDATFGAEADMSYKFGFGVDTDGFWLQQGSGVSLSLMVDAGIEGDVEILGLPLASAGGALGFQVTPSVSLAADPYSPVAGHDYLSDLLAFGSNPADDFLDALSAGIAGGFTGTIYGSIDLLFFSISKSFSVYIPIFNYQTEPAWPEPGSPGAASNPWPTPVDGVLTIPGTPGADIIRLSGSDGTMSFRWAGHGNSPTYTGIKEVVFDGDGGSDQLTTESGFNIPIDATASGTSSVYFEGGAGNDTLVGGQGNDTLVGGDGDDSIVAGPGADLILGGDGDDSIDGGTGGDTIFGGAGNDLINAGSGLYYVDGGAGNDTIYGGAGGSGTGSAKFFQATMGGQLSQGTETVVTSPTIRGGSGNDLIYGPTSAASIFGDSGDDTIIGGPGNDTIDGGSGDDLLYGEGGDDVIDGGIGDDTIFGGLGNDVIDGGDGNDLLFGGDGLDLNGPGSGDGLDAGNNILIGDSGNDVLFGDSTGHNLLYGDYADSTVPGAVGNDILFAGSGGDTLDGGGGSDILEGGPGNDYLVIHFDPPGEPQQTPETLSGGAGYDTALLMGTDFDDVITLRQSDPGSSTYQATLGGATHGSADFTLPDDVEGIEIDGGDGNDSISVSSEITQGVTLNGGAGNDTLIGGSGSDLLIGGPGNDLLDGMAGNDILYGDDQPTQDTTAQADGGTANAAQVPGSDTLIGGEGDDQLYGSDGGDVLIGGDVSFQPGLLVPISSVGEDILFGGAGNDLLIAGPGSLGAQMEGGGGNDILIGDNGSNVMDGGTGSDLLLGGNLGNTIYGNFSNDPSDSMESTTEDPGNDTLVGGTGTDDLVGDGDGNDLLLGDESDPRVASLWAHAEAVALGDGVAIQPTAALVGPQPIQEYDELQSQEDALAAQIEVLQNVPNPTAAQAAQLTELRTEQNFVLQELIEVNDALGAAGTPDRLVAGLGNDTLEGGVAAALLEGGAGNDLLYYNPRDTYTGDTSGQNTILFQETTPGDAIELTYVASDPQAENLPAIRVSGSTTYDWPITVGIQDVGVDALGAGDDVTVDFGQSAKMGVFVQLGPGADTIDATTLQAGATLLGGSGNDTIEIGTTLTNNAVYDGGTGSSTLVIQCAGGAVTNAVTVSKGKLTVGNVAIQVGGTLQAANGVTATVNDFQGLEVLGGSGATNDFSTDGTFPDAVFRGGSGAGTVNDLQASGNQSTLIGGSGINMFTIVGAGAYTVIGGPGVNDLSINADNNGDAIHLSEVNSAGLATISVSGSMTATASNLAVGSTGVAVMGGAGNDVLDASGMILPVVLDGGSGVDTLIGGAGNDTLVYRGGADVINGGGGVLNELAYPANTGDNIDVFPASLEVNGTIETPLVITNIENTVIQGNPASVGTGDDFSSPPIGWGSVLLHFVDTNDSGSSVLSQGVNGIDGPFLSGVDTTVGPTGEPAFGHILPGLTYNPATEGAISSINISMDFTSNVFESQVMYPLIEQGGYYYLGDPYPSPSEPNTYNTWGQLVYNNLTQNVFDGNQGGVFNDNNTPNFSSSGAPIQFGFLTVDPGYGSYSWGADNFAVTINNGRPPQTSWANDPVPLTNATIAGLSVAGNSATTVLTAGFTDTNPRATTATETATIAWGDGTTSTGSIASTSGENYAITASHVYAADAPYQVTLTIVDRLGAASSVVANYSGGLEPDGSGNLSEVNGTTSTLLDTGVSTYLVDNADAATFSLHADQSLWAIVGGSKSQVDSGVKTIVERPDGTLFVLHGSGSLSSIAPDGSFASQFVASSVQSLVEDGIGDVDRLNNDGSLDSLAPGASPTTGWSALRDAGEPNSAAGSITAVAGGASIDVVFTDGDDWQLVGSMFGDEVKPTFVLSATANQTAGVAFPVTLKVLDDHGDIATGYQGTVALTLAGVTFLSSYAFTPADGGVYTFMPAIDVAGPWAIDATDVSSGLSTTAAVAVAPNAPALIDVVLLPQTLGQQTLQEGTVAGAVNIYRVSAKDVYGNVVTWDNDTVSLGSSDSHAVLPPGATATLSGGVATITVAFRASGDQTVAAIDGDPASGVSAPTAVSPGVATHFVILAPQYDPIGQTFALTVEAEDAFGNVATGYTGTIDLGFTNTGGMVEFTGLPASYTFTTTGSSPDLGVHTFEMVGPVPGLTGPQVVTAADPSLTNSEGMATIDVNEVEPTALSAVAGSATFGGSATLTATLTRNGSPLAGESVAFVLDIGGTMIPVGSATTGANGVALLSGVDLNGLGAGTFAGAVVASFAGDPVDAESGGSGTLTVEPATATLAFGPLTLAYDGSPQPVQVTTNPAGLPGVTLAYYLDGVAVDPPTEPGTYSVVASLANPNYQAASISGTLVIAPAASQLVLTTPPPAVVSAGSAFGLVVTVEGASGQVDATYDGVVTIALGADPAGGKLGGTLTETAVDGVATFAGLTLSTEGTGYTLVATAANLNQATSAPIELNATTRSDFFGDGRDDFGVFGYQRFIIAEPSTGQVIEKAFGGPEDVPVVGDFFGDGRDDFGVQGYQRYIVYNPGTGATLTQAFGGPDDVPVVGDFFGDGHDDFAVYGYQRFIIVDPITHQTLVQPLGGPDDVPVVGDFFDNGHDDLGVFGDGRFLIFDPATGQMLTQSFGGPEDVPVVGDFFGDGHDDFAVYGYGRFLAVDPSTHQTITQSFGGPADIPVIGDFFGNNRDDFGVFGYDRFIVVDPVTHQTLEQSFGGPADVPSAESAATILLDGTVRTESVAVASPTEAPSSPLASAASTETAQAIVALGSTDPTLRAEAFVSPAGSTPAGPSRRSIRSAESRDRLNHGIARSPVPQPNTAAFSRDVVRHPLSLDSRMPRHQTFGREVGRHGSS